MAAPTGFLWSPYTAMREVIATSASFQTWTGAVDAAAAKLFVTIFEKTEDLYAQTKYAVVMFPDDDWLSLEKDTSMGGVGLAAMDWSRKVRFGFLWELTEDELGEGNAEYSEANATTFLNTLGIIVAEMLNDAQMAQVMGVEGVPLTRDNAMRWKDGARRGYQLFFEVRFST